MSNVVVARKPGCLWNAAMVACSTAAAAFGQTQVLVEETFESVDLPANGWTIADRNASGSPAYWAMASTGFANLAAYEGLGMAYCAGTGFQGPWNDPKAQGYMCAVMEREVDLTGAGMASLGFNYHIPSIAHGEGLEVYLDDRRVCSLTAASPNWTAYVAFVDEHCGSIRTLRFVWYSMGHTPGTGAFLDNVRLTKVPDGSPVVRGPASGEHFWHRRPHFQWPAVSGATWYNLWLVREGRAYQNVWVAAPAGTPTWQTAADLPGGSYQWWVRPWSPGVGLGAWSEAATFSVETMRPVAPTQLWPSGEQFSGDVEYGWILEDASRASWHRLWVGRDGSGTWHDRWHNLAGSGLIGLGWASVLPGAHRGGSYQWWVRAWSVDGYGDWSGPMIFSVPSQDPTPSEPGYPNGINVSVPRPAFEWRTSERAEWYRLYVLRGATKVVDHWTPNTYWNPTFDLSPGDYSWWVGAWNSTTRTTIWSGRGDFGVR